MKSNKNAARFFGQIVSIQSERLRQQALESPQLFIKLAKAQGHHLTIEHLSKQIMSLSEETIAAILAPGIGNRRHLIRR